MASDEPGDGAHAIIRGDRPDARELSGPAVHWGTWPSRSSCSPRRAATARASTGPCRPSSARSSSTARRSTCARRSSTTSTSSSSCASAARSSSTSWTTRSPRARSRSSARTACRRPSTPTPRRRGLQTIDATCPLVTKVHREALKFAAEGYTIVLIGHAGHEEVEGTMGEAPDAHVLVETEADVDALEVADPEKRRLRLADHAVGRRDDARSSTGCASASRTSSGRAPTTSATRRPTASPPSSRWPAQCDLVLVIGSQNSSNSQRLVEVAREHGAEAHLIDNAGQVREEWLDRQARRRHLVRRQRARGARPAPRRLLPRARRRGRLGVRGRPGGRPLHAPEDDPPGPGGQSGLTGAGGAELPPPRSRATCSFVFS